MKFDLAKYLEIPYDAETFDCVDLVRLVETEVFNRTVNIVGMRPRGVRGQLALGALSKQYAERTDVPTNGDLVLMTDCGSKNAAHAGIYFFIAHEPYVLHVSEGTQQSVMQRIRDLPFFGARIEGYYKWI